jgi:hypothetical protein
MRRTLASISLLAAAVAASHNVLADEPAGTKAAQTVVLFDGKSLDGWNFHLVDPDVKMEDVWSVDQGVLVCKGEPLGYLVTKESFKNFRLVVEWRWAPGKEPGNSGVLLRIAGEPIGFMPKCVEAQLMSGNAGDIWAFRGASLKGDEDRFRKIENHEALGDFLGVGKIKGAEKPPGEWNRMVVKFSGETITVVVNGEKVNEATGCDVVSGPIGLQSEGGEIHFRTVKLTPLE